MLFRSLEIQNFRGISLFSVQDLTDFVMVAGPNGCGKSCVFDAIRLLKSLYGGYAPNEWHHFFAELQIDMNASADLRKLFRNSQSTLKIMAEIELADSERSYLHDNATAVLLPFHWAQATGQDMAYRRYAQMSALLQAPEQRAAIEAHVATEVPRFQAEVMAPLQRVAVEIEPDTLRLTIEDNRAMQVFFATYDPDNLGVLEYHSASRTYQREALGGIDLNVKNFDEQRRQSTLYNWQQKYANIKSELAATYLRDLVSKEVDEQPDVNSVNETIKELFRQFFPDKEYLGVRPEAGGTLSFPVKLSNGDVHDINELSSGEKELVYGYLRLRNSAPRNSTILLDEPELHLNPGLLKGLVSFYHQNLGRAHGNQLWLVTHSDALLRQAVVDKGFSVFHMSPLHALESEGANQATAVKANDELEQAIISMVGDLATYRPTARVVIVEGGGDTDFDAAVVTRLAPEFAKRVNLVSGGDKRRVQALYETLEKSGDKLGSSGRFFTIVDSDFDSPSAPANTHSYSWGVYHIENFLLDDHFIMRAVNSSLGRQRFANTDEVADELKRCAEQVMAHAVYDLVRSEVNDLIVGKIAVGGEPDADLVSSLQPSLESTFSRLENVRDLLLGGDEIEQIVTRVQADFESSLEDGSWRSRLPGRKILRRFAGDVCGSMAPYETLRNLIISYMEDAGHRPSGMDGPIDAILATPIELG